MQISFLEYCCKGFGGDQFQSTVIRVLQISFTEYCCKGLCRYHFQILVSEYCCKGLDRYHFQSSVCRVYADITFRILL